MSFYGKLSPWGRCKTACWLRSASSPQPSLFCRGLEVNKKNKHINCSCTITASVRKDAGWVHGLYWSEFLGKRLAPVIQCLWRKQCPEVHLYKVLPEHFVRMLLTEGEKKRNVLISLNRLLPKWKPRQGMRVGKRDSCSGQVLLEGSWLAIPAHFSENVHFKQFFFCFK